MFDPNPDGPGQGLGQGLGREGHADPDPRSSKEAASGGVLAASEIQGSTTLKWSVCTNSNECKHDFRTLGDVSVVTPAPCGAH